MKTFILILSLLSFSQVKGQVHISGGAVTLDQYFHAQELQQLKAFVKAYDEYKTKCWNDSTPTNCAVFRSFRDGHEFTIEDYKKDPDESMVNLVKEYICYKHRTPTFENFVEYLRNKK